MKKIFFLLLFFIGVNLSAQNIVDELDGLVNGKALQSSEIGISVYDLTAGKSLYKYQDAKLYRPASIEKIVTAVTALNDLGTNFTFDTRLCYSGFIKNGTLHGNLYLIGGFDPEFMESDLDKFVTALKNSGIKNISDTLITDVSMTDSLYWGPGWAWDDTPYYFQPYLSPLMLNRGYVDVTLTPLAKDSKPRVRISPASNYYNVINDAVSKNKNAGKLVVTRDWLNNNNTIIIKGDVSSPTTKKVNLYNSQNFFLRTFINRLNKNGITAKHYEYASCNSKEKCKNLITIRRPMKDVLNRALKKSDNLCAEAVFYNLGHKMLGKNNISSVEAASVIKNFIKNKLPLNSFDYNIVDGCGVSMYNYVSPELIMEYLKYAHQYPKIFTTFYNSLPIAGVDGTLRNRMKGKGLYGNVRAKTGTVTGVSSLAGYVRGKNNHLLAFVIINQNILNKNTAHGVQDEICGILSKY